MVRQCRSSLTAVVAAILIALAGVAVPATASAAPSTMNIPIVGSGAGATFAGTFNLASFAVENGQVVARGLLSGVLTQVTPTGPVQTSIVQQLSLPVAVGQTTCEILHLDLGPLHLTLLGLNIDLSRIVLDITATTGAGNLLGNLLCAVAGLLDNPTGLARLLNQILGAILG
jgi:hypothetical protein